MRFKYVALLVMNIILISCTPATVDFSASQLNNLKYSFSSSHNPQTALILYPGDGSAINFKTSDTVLSSLEIKIQYEILSAEKFDISTALEDLNTTHTIQAGSSGFSINLKAKSLLPFSGTAEIKMTVSSVDNSLEIFPNEYKIKILNQAATNPSITFNTLPTYVNQANALTFLISGTCSDITQFKLVISSVNYDVNCIASAWSQITDLTSLSDGTLTIEAKNSSTTTTYQTTIIGKDTLAPVVSSINDSTIHASSTTTPTITWTTAELGSGVQFYEIALGSTNLLQDAYSWTNIGNITSKQITGLNLTNTSTYYVQIRATDNAGNVSIAYAGDGFTVNTALPVATISTPPPSFTNSSSFNFTIGGVNITHYSYKFGVSGSTDCTVASGYSTIFPIGSNISIAGANSTDTLYKLCVVGKNTALVWQNHSDATVVTWTYDSTNPILSISSPSAGSHANNSNYTNFTVTSTCSEPGRSVDFYVESINDNTKYFSTSTTCSLGQATKSLNLSLIPDGNFFVRTSQTDLAGNLGTSSQANYIKDAIVPTFPDTNITMTAYGNSLSSTPPFSWTSATDTGGSGISSYKLAIGTSVGDTSVLNWADIGNVTSHTATGLTLSDGQTYYVSIKAYDAAGNPSALISKSWIVDALGPLMTISSPTSGMYINQDNKSSFSFTTTCELGLAITFEVTSQVTPTSTQTVNDTCSTSPRSVNLDLSTYPEGSVLFRVSQTDLAGNLGSSSRVIVKDTTAPNFTGTVADGLYYNLLTQSPTISWSTATDANGILRYEIALGSGTGTDNIAAWVNVGSSTSYQFSGLALTNNTTYFPSVRAIDFAGNVSSLLIGDGWLTDNTPPDAPTNLIDGDQWATANSTPNLSWTTPADVGSGVSSYKVRIMENFSTEILSWNKIASTSYTTSTPTLIPGTIYNMEVKAIDWAGNESTAAISNGWLQVNPGWKNESFIKAANAEASDYFGSSIAIDGDTLVVGAYNESSGQTTITNGATASGDNSISHSGAAYVYKRLWNSSLRKYEWNQEAYLKASNPDIDDQFGISVGISGDTIIVGAQGESSNQTTITNGDTPASADNSVLSSGSVYVYKRTGATWNQEAYLKAPNAESSDLFGITSAISNDTIVVGATYEDSAETTITNSPIISFNNSATNSGAAYVFTRSGATWTFQSYLKASNTNAADQFGYSVAISNNTIVVGAPFEASNQTTITNGSASSSNNSALSAGAAYVFTRSGGFWSQEAYLKASNSEAGDQFGFSVSIHNDTIVVGAPFEDSIEDTIINGSSSSFDNSASSAGAAYVFTRSGGFWSQEAYLKAPNTLAFNQFGHSVATSGDRIVVGATGEKSSQTTIINGDTASADTSAVSSGAAYVFYKDGSIWRNMAYIKAPNANTNDYFGRRISISGNTVSITAPLEDSNINFIQNQESGFSSDDTATESGAAYVFKFD